MSVAAKKRHESLVVLTAEDLRRTLRISRSSAHRLMRQGGATKVGARAVRLAAAKLVELLGRDLADAVIDDARQRDEERQ